MATRLNGRDGFGTFQRGRIHVSIDIFNLNSFLFRRWETIIVFLPSRGLLWGFLISSEQLRELQREDVWIPVVVSAEAPEYFPVGGVLLVGRRRVPRVAADGHGG